MRIQKDGSDRSVFALVRFGIEISPTRVDIDFHLELDILGQLANMQIRIEDFDIRSVGIGLRFDHD